MRGQEAANDLDLIILELDLVRSDLLRIAALCMNNRRVPHHSETHDQNRNRGRRSQNRQQPVTFSQLHDFSPTSILNCAAVSGTTERRPWRTIGESANVLLPFISASVTGFFTGFPALIFTTGFFAFGSSIDTTVAVPTALF